METEGKGKQLIICNARGDKRLATLPNLTCRTTVAQLKNLVHSKHGLASAERQSYFIYRGNKEKVYLKDSETLEQHGLHQDDELTIYYKDLGVQVAWRTVFMVEYAGPLLIYLFFYFQIPYFGYTPVYTTVKDLACLCWVGHYVKRELETVFVHRFSHGTMPLLNIFKNSGYYWGFGALCGYAVNHPTFQDPPAIYVTIGLLVFIACEIGNLICHIQLRNLRPEGSTVRRIPKGFLFEYVSCPNYTCEILAWLAFAFMTQSLCALLFAGVGAAQMWVWAKQKHVRYRKEFPDYPTNRKILVPFIF